LPFFDLIPANRPYLNLIKHKQNNRRKRLLPRESYLHGRKPHDLEKRPGEK